MFQPGMSSPNPALESFLRSIPLFSLVEAEDMLELLRLLRPVTLESGQVLFRERDPGDAMWILEGTAEVSVLGTPQGATRAVPIAYMRAGETVGEMALIDDQGRSATAVVAQSGAAYQIHALDFDVLRQAYNPAAFKVLRRMAADLCARLRATADRIAPAVTQPQGQTTLKTRRATAQDIREYGPFEAMPQVARLALEQKMSVVETREVQPIFAEGEDGDSAYFVVQGEVTAGRAGRTLANLGPGSMFGIVAAVDGGQRSANCLTTGPAKLLRLSRQDFNILFEAGNRFAFQLVDRVCRQLVEHLRTANMMLPTVRAPPILAQVPESPPPPPQPRPIQEEEVLAELLPLDLEMELKPEAAMLTDEPL
jgi:CRP-like cAMP-binding protein